MKKFDDGAWAAILDQTIENIKRLSASKGAEYTQGRGDRLDNFRRAGEVLDLRMETIWAVYAGKHWDAVMTYVRDVEREVKRERSEPITGRIDDLIVYLLLLKAMCHERGTA